METRNYKFIGRKEDLDTLEKLFSHMEFLGIIGASRNILVRVDGDGVGRIKVRNDKNEKLDNEMYNTEQNLGQGALVAVYDIG